ncbi:hypothetical protein [Actinoplanes sp. NPDC026623]|uniref:hypothetical protein n=1 Tax=Actinoplanes sp. NPDC026623 TaxID=3155610 RepID=UPI0033F58B4A
MLTRFGFDGALAHRLAAGLDYRPLAVRRPPPDLDVCDTYDEPLERVDVAAFAGRVLADRLHDQLAAHGLACTRLGIEAVTADGQELHRVWRHDGTLTAAAIAERVRWQLDGWLTGARRGVVNRPTAGLVRLRLVPEGVLVHLGLQPGLWGDAGSERERAHRALSRIQGLLGPEAVVTAVLGGGRSADDQVRLVPWGDERAPARPGGDPATPLPEPDAVAVSPAAPPALVALTSAPPPGEGSAPPPVEGSVSRSIGGSVSLPVGGSVSPPVEGSVLPMGEDSARLSVRASAVPAVGDFAPSAVGDGERGTAEKARRALKVVPDAVPLKIPRDVEEVGADPADAEQDSQERDSQEQGTREQGMREQGMREQGTREQGTREQGSVSLKDSGPPDAPLALTRKAAEKSVAQAEAKAVKAGAVQVGAARTGMAQARAVRVGAVQAEAARVEAARVEAARVGVDWGDAGRVGVGRDRGAGRGRGVKRPVPLPPWPGRLPRPAPALVLPQALPAVVLDADGQPVGVSARLELSGDPAFLLIENGGPIKNGGLVGNGGRVEITGWAGPWPVDERWWAPAEARRRARFQIAVADGRAFLLSLVSGHWAVEAIYD